MFKTKATIAVLEVVRAFVILFAVLCAVCSFLFLCKTPSMIDQGKSILYLNGIYYQMLFYSLLPSFLYIALGYMVKWKMKDKFRIIQKSVFTNRVVIAILFLMHYAQIIFTFIGVCIAHTHYIWLISIPVLLFILLIDIIGLVYLGLLED